MNAKTYYEAPSDEIFNEIKEKAIQIWRTYDDTHLYATEKIRRFEHIPNVRDNAAYIVAMFDYSNQNRLLQLVNGETKAWLTELLLYSMGHES